MREQKLTTNTSATAFHHSIAQIAFDFLAFVLYSVLVELAII